MDKEVPNNVDVVITEKVDVELRHDKDKADVWKYFQKGQEKGTAVCNICKTVLKATGGSTSGLIGHVKTKHEINVLKRKGPESPSIASSSKTRITKFFQPVKKDKNSFDTVLSRMVALDGFTFRVFTSSVDLRRALNAYGYEVPKSPKTIRKIVMEFSDTILKQEAMKINELARKGGRFNISHDEWSSMKSRRYLNIVLHYGKSQIWNLGLIRVKGSMNSETIVQKIEERLQTFGISIERHIICQMTDGCKTMIKVGKISSCEQQLCFAHGVQLAVLDVLYEKPKKKKNRSNDDTDDDECEQVDDVDSDEDEIEISDDDRFCFAEDFLIEMEADGNFEVTVEESEDDVPELPPNLKGIVDKVRKIVKMFKRSPVKNDVLQKYVTEQMNRELQLLLDCQTRWSSLVDMLDRFYEIRKPVKKALVDVGGGLDVDDDECSVILEIVDALKPIKAAVEALCRRDANLVTADAILSFTMKQLHKQNTGLSMALFDALEKRMSERRTDLSGVLSYLHTGSFSPSLDNSESENDSNISAEILDIFNIPSRKTVESVMYELLRRTESEQPKPNEGDKITGERVQHVQSTGTANPPKNNKKSTSILHKNLESAITNTLSSPVESNKPKSKASLLKVIRQEMRLLEAGGNRGRYLSKAYEHLLGLNRQVLSRRGYFLLVGTYARKFDVMSDKTLNNLSFLRTYFQTINPKHF